MLGSGKGKMSSPRSKRTVSLSKVVRKKKTSPPRGRASSKKRPPSPPAPSLLKKRGKSRSRSRTPLPKPQYQHQKGVDYVFVDGSTFSNVRKNPFSKGGIGVFFGDGDKRNISEPFYLKPVTNNRCELYACIKAIENYAASKNLEKQKHSLNIYCDSMYVINSVTKWINKWKYNGWKTSKGTDVENKDLIVWIDKLLQTYCSTISIRFIHVRAHKKQPSDKRSEQYFYWYGNHMADRFAVGGSTQSVGGKKK
jgi:ribonuclease HI